QRAILWSVDAWQQFKIIAGEAVLVANKGLIDLLDSLRTFAALYDQMAAKLGGTQIGDGIEQAVRKLQDLRREMIKFQDAQKAAPKASLAVAEAFDKARDDIQKTRDLLKNQPALDVNNIAPAAAAAAKAPGAPKFASVAAAGSAEAANAVLKAR